MISEPTNPLISEIIQDIDHHKKWEGRDFSWAQIFVWIGIIASVAASLNATGVLPITDKLYSAVLAVIPGAVLIVEKTFRFSARASWHALYRASLNGLYRKMRDEGISSGIVSVERSKLEFEMEKMFPTLDPNSLGSKTS